MKNIIQNQLKNTINPKEGRIKRGIKTVETNRKQIAR